MNKFKKVLAAIMLMTAVIMTACSPEDDPNNNGNNNGGGINENVTVITTTPQDITLTSAVCGGAVSVSEGITLSEVGVCWSTNSTPTVAGSHVSAGGVEERFSCTVSGLAPDTKYYVCAYALCGEKYYYGNVKDFTTESNGGGGGSGTYNGHDYVDLGLPNGTLWATCNVGATTPEGFGDYFAWGEIQTKTIYDWSTYKYCNGKYNQLTKYCNDDEFGYNGFTDTLTVLLPEDDAATVNWGNGWCMPTYAQWNELCQNTTHTWTTMNGVDGRLFTASNGNTLFLPSAGCREGGELTHLTSGVYWSSLLSGCPSCAWFIYFYQGEYNLLSAGDRRPYGQSIRAVRSPRQN